MNRQRIILKWLYFGSAMVLVSADSAWGQTGAVHSEAAAHPVARTHATIGSASHTSQDSEAPMPEPQTHPTPVVPAPEGEATVSIDGVQEIVVTAAKRETSLQRTPQAVSVLDGTAQFAKGQTRLEDIRLSVPNVNFAATTNTTQLYVRGIGSTFLNSGGDPGVALYVDNAYVSDQTTTNISFFDVQRIEVLRGPQGALYGRNATGGAIAIISAKPTDKFSGRISGTIGNLGRRETEGFVSGPLGIADTDVRVSYQVKHLDGYTRNLIAGQPGAPDKLDDLDSQAVRVRTLTHFANSGTLGIIATFYRQKDAGATLGIKPLAGIQYPVELLNGEVPTPDPRATFANVGSNDIRVFNLNAALEQPIGAATLSVTGNYRFAKGSFVNDCDGTRIDNCRFNRDNRGRDYYADVHLAGPSDAKLRYLVGATYLRFDINSRNDVPFVLPLSYLVPGGPTNIPFAVDVISGGRVHTESYAIYADLRLKLNDIWSIAGQARYNKTIKKAHAILQIDAFGVNVPDFPTSLENSFVPWKIGIEGQLTPDVLVYANYASAYKDGAINLGALQTTPVRPERVRSAELGFKSTFFDRRLQVNGAAFNSSYTDLQLSQLIGTNVTLVNAPKATINGAEIEIVGAPLSGLQLKLNVGYLDPQLKSFSNGQNLPGLIGGPPIDLSGNQLPYAAKLSLNASADYKFEPTPGYVAVFGGEYSYHSRVYFNEFNDRFNSQGPVGLVNLSASFAPVSEEWKAFFYLNNATNKTVETGATIYSGLLGASRAVNYAPPRHFGAGLSFSF